MSASLSVRPFHREDRDQLTDLVNAHTAAVVPGAAVSVNTVLTSLERRPEEYIIDPWVAERVTLVAEERRRIVAAAHLLRYRNDPDVGEDYRDTGHIAWFLHTPPEEPAAPGEESGRAAEVLMSACLAQLTRWHVRARHADGQLPSPGVQGVPEQWPHVRAVLARAGFVHTGPTEVLSLAAVRDLPAPGPAPVPGMTLRRTLGPLGTRLTARLGGADAGHIELDTTLDRPERHARSGGMAEIADLELPGDAHPELLGWLLGGARQWLELCGCDRLLTCAYEDEAGEIEAMSGFGFRELTRTARGWDHLPD
ncbi:N-acetyltransferase [Streptomyces sp. CAU 1734]|uniref:N-acetyltransferase n=1 Tax=Streptomyces sp. CAU 1734 TaxID=3140360 RepID=UPI003261708F